MVGQERCPQVRIGILALQGDVREHRAAFADLGVAARAVRQPADLAGLDGIVLPGGESTTMSMLLESSGLTGPLRAALAGGLPALGTCAGMILLASRITDGRPDQLALGAIDLHVRRNGYGRQLQSFECTVDVAGLSGGPVPAVFIRAPVVEWCGPQVEVLAWLAVSGSADRTPVLCRHGSVLVAAFHPELTGDRRLHQLFVSMVRDDRELRDRVGQTVSAARTG